MPGVKTDTGAKTITIDGVSTNIKGRIKTVGNGDTTGKSIRISVRNGGGTLRFFVQGANTSDTTRTYTIADEKGNALFTSATGVSPSAPEEYSYVFAEAGTYYLYSGVNGINFYYLDLTQTLKLGEETGFEVNRNNVKKDYLVGDSLDLSALSVSAVYSSGAKLALSAKDYTVDASGFDSTKAGTYSIKITYKSYAVSSFEVVVHAVQSIKAYATPVMATSGSKTIYRTPSVYKLGAIVDTSHVVVKAVTDLPNETILPVTAYTITGPDTSSAGVKAISVAYKDTLTASIPVSIIDTSTFLPESEVNTVYVDASKADGSQANGHWYFHSVQSAHDFLQAVCDATAKKAIVIADGIYHEKLYFEIPNLSVSSASADYAKVTLESSEDADSLDANGIAWSTYGSGSVTVLDAATAFRMKNITVKNAFFTSMDDYNSKSGNKQGCALVNNAPESVFLGCHFVGFQDTLYAHAGSQYYQDCVIEGMTDYIFGEALNVVFKACLIISLNRSDAKNGGYICAPKPGTLTSSDVGFVFENCTIEGEDGVSASTVSLARPWGATAKASFLNCAMDKAISKSAYPCTEHNARYEIMSANTPDKASFSEYGNTGDGAINEAVVGCTILSETDYTAFASLVTSAIAFAA